MHFLPQLQIEMQIMDSFSLENFAKSIIAESLDIEDRANFEASTNSEASELQVHNKTLSFGKFYAENALIECTCKLNNDY